MQHIITFASQGNNIIVNPSSLNVRANDTVVFVAADANHYDVVIPNKDNFFVNNDNGATLEYSVTQSQSVTTPTVNKKPDGTVKYYSVTTPGGGIPYAPPRIVVVN
jgi:plastocyanin